MSRPRMGQEPLECDPEWIRWGVIRHDGGVRFRLFVETWIWLQRSPRRACR